MMKCIVAVSVFVCVSALNTESTENVRHVGEDMKMETHQVTTPDLYILTVFRLRNLKKDIRKNQYSVLMFHGLMQSSDRFIEHGRNVSLAYDLADAGFDVWLGNNRGNKYSRHHAYLNPDDPEDKLKFFNFTYEDIGVNDVAAIVDYILVETKTNQLHYVGHSQGGTVFFALNSMRPEYNEKFLTANLLAGAGYPKHFSNSLLEILSSLVDKIYALLLEVGYVEVFPSDSVVRISSSNTIYDLVNSCLSPTHFQNLCQMLHASTVLGIQGTDKKKMWFAGGGAVKQMVLFGQNVKLKRFCRWDYGKRNEQVYGTRDPPNYDLSLIMVNTTLHFGMGDVLVNYKDVIDMANDMPNARTRKVDRHDFGHSDFTDALDAKELVYNYIVEELLLFEGDNEPNIVEKKSPLYLTIMNTSNPFIKTNSNTLAPIQPDSPITLISYFTTSAPYPSNEEVLRRNVSDFSNITLLDSLPRHVSNSLSTKIPNSLSNNISETTQSDVLHSLSANTLVSSSGNVLDSSTTNILNSSRISNPKSMTTNLPIVTQATLLNSFIANNSDRSDRNGSKLLPKKSYRRMFTNTNVKQSSLPTVPAASTKSCINTALLITALLTVKICWIPIIIMIRAKHNR